MLELNFFSQSAWRCMNYPIRKGLQITQNRTGSWGLPSLYISTSIVHSYPWFSSFPGFCHLHLTKNKYLCKTKLKNLIFLRCSQYSYCSLNFVIAIVVAFNLFVLFFIPILWFMDSNFYRSLSKENLFLYCILEIWFYKSFALILNVPI